MDPGNTTPPHPTASGGDSPTKPAAPLTQENALLLGQAFTCQKGTVDIDYDLLARKMGYKNGGSARAQLYKVKVKLWLAGGATPTKLKATKEKDSKEKDTPSKKTNVDGVRKPRAPRKNSKAARRAAELAVKQEEEGGDDGAAGEDEDNGDVFQDAVDDGEEEGRAGV